MNGLLAATHLTSSFSEAPRHNRRSNRIRAKTLPKRQDFVLEPLKSCLPRIACLLSSLFKVLRFSTAGTLILAFVLPTTVRIRGKCREH
jgi:hypothetical protein